MAGVDVTIALPSIEALVLQLHGRSRALTPDEADVVDTYAGEVRDYVVDRWPVDTGTSADAWQYEVSGSPGTYGFTISNDIDYVEWVHLAGTPPGGDLWEALIGQGWALVRASLLVDLEVAVRATEARATTPGGVRRAFTEPIRLVRVAA